MAWISVHEQVVGGKLRELSRELCCSQNEALGILVILWLWGINNAGEDGIVAGVTKDDIERVLYFGLDKRISPLAVVDALISTHWIDIDTDICTINDWKNMQGEWYRTKRLREKDKERKRKERSIAKGKSNSNSEDEIFKEDNNTCAEIKDELTGIPEKVVEDIEVIEVLEDKNESKSEKVKTKRRIVEYPEGFEKFWKEYPRRIGKGDAYIKYKARLKEGWTDEQILEATINYRESEKDTELRYLKHPKTFLAKTTPFEDYMNYKINKKDGKKEDKKEISSSNDGEDNPYAVWEK